MKPNNIVVCQERRYEINETLWYPVIRTRYNFSTIETVAEFRTVAAAVEAGKILSSKLGIPLTVSTKYLNRPETVGLKMFGD